MLTLPVDAFNLFTIHPKHTYIIAAWPGKSIDLRQGGIALTIGRSFVALHSDGHSQCPIQTAASKVKMHHPWQ